MSASERDIQNTIAETLLWDGWLVLRVNSGAMKSDDGRRYVRFCTWQALGFEASESGVSDLIASHGRKTVYIECKTARGKQRDSQQRFQEACESVGVEYIVARGLGDVMHLLRRALPDTRAQTAWATEGER